MNEDIILIIGVVVIVVFLVRLENMDAQQKENNQKKDVDETFHKLFLTEIIDKE